jgi:ubiquitin-protein ligase
VTIRPTSYTDVIRSPALSVSKLLLSLVSLLTDPNPGISINISILLIIPR